MRLWGRKSSINVQKVLWCLAELGLKEGEDFERIDAGLDFGKNRTPEFLALNPNGLVPTLEDGDLVLGNPTPSCAILLTSTIYQSASPPTLQASIHLRSGWIGS